MEDNKNNEKNTKTNTKKVILVILGFAIAIGVFFLLEYLVGPKLGHIEQSIWLVSGIFWFLGLLAWVVTYIGAPRASKKSGKFVSGIPGVAFICFLIAGLISPCKWLALLALTDFGITLLPVYRFIKNKKNE